MKLFAVKDNKAEGFNPPFTQQTFGLAERTFAEATRDPASHISKFKNDFSLWHVGDFDQNTGIIEPVNPPKQICEASQFDQVQ